MKNQDNDKKIEDAKVKKLLRDLADILSNNEDYINEAHEKGVILGKADENSLLDIIEPTLKSINTKLTSLEEYIEGDLAWKEEFEVWKKEITPQITLVKDFQGWGKVSLGLVGILSLVGGTIITLINLFKIK